jgi:hypothetical protein
VGLGGRRLASRDGENLSGEAEVIKSPVINEFLQKAVNSDTACCWLVMMLLLETRTVFLLPTVNKFCGSQLQRGPQQEQSAIVHHLS